MKTIVRTLVAAMATLSLLTFAAFADSPNNYIYTDNNGVVYEIEQGGSTYTTKKPITSRDMATQEELEEAMKPRGLSLTAAMNSFTGNGVGVGLSYDFDGYSEVSIGVGGDLTENTRIILGVTHDSFSHTTATIGVGVSF